MKSKHYDIIILGAGQAGVPLAEKMAKAGKKVALVERGLIGGSCINYGCTPTKTWIASAKAAYSATRSAKLGVPVKKFSVNMTMIKTRKDEIVKQFRSGSQESLEQTSGLDVIFGEARFVDTRKLSVSLSDGIKEIDAELIFINTGAGPFIPPIQGLEQIAYLTSTTILDLKKIPRHLLVLGGNYIGLEFSQMFRRFGSKVTVIEKSANILYREDEDISSEMHKILSLEAINIFTQTEATAFEYDKKGNIIVTLKENGKEKGRRVSCTHVLIATGRKPQTDSLHLDIPGIRTDEKGYIRVNTELETNIKGIYALGDVNGGPAFTHISYNDYTIVYRNIMEKGHYSTENRPLPYCVFTDPQLGRIGLNEQDAARKGIKVKVVRLPMSHVARAIETGDTRGVLKALVDPSTKKILGAAFLGAQGGELMSIIQMAIEGGLTYDKLAYGIFAHPLYAEALNNLFLQLEN